jgi:hypothetical protein
LSSLDLEQNLIKIREEMASEWGANWSYMY